MRFIKQISKERSVFLLLCIALISLAFGMRLNFIAMLNNNCKMPVINEPFTQEIVLKKNLTEYFLYNSSEQVNYYYLSDIIPLPFMEGYLSIGDILLYIALDLFIIIQIALIINFFRKREDNGS